MSTWQPISTAPKDGTAFRAYGPSLVHPDFNPWGSVEAVFDGERFIGAEWDGQHDIWNTVFLDGRATHWMPLPDPPQIDPSSVSSKGKFLRASRGIS